MTAVQLVLDQPLLKAIDRQARKRSVSRSEFVRDSLREVLARLQYLEDLEQERRAYARTPVTAAERALQRAMRKRSGAALSADGDRW